MACDNNQYFEFHEMQLNWSIYRASWCWLMAYMIIVHLN